MADRTSENTDNYHQHPVSRTHIVSGIPRHKYLKAKKNKDEEFGLRSRKDDFQSTTMMDFRRYTAYAYFFETHFITRFQIWAKKQWIRKRKLNFLGSWRISKGILITFNSLNEAEVQLVKWKGLLFIFDKEHRFEDCRHGLKVRYSGLGLRIKREQSTRERKRLQAWCKNGRRIHGWV